MARSASASDSASGRVTSRPFNTGRGMCADGATRVPPPSPGYSRFFSCSRVKKFAFRPAHRAFIPAGGSTTRGIAIAPTVDMRASLRAAIVLGGVLLLALPGTAQRRETDADTDLRRFYEIAGNRGVWIDTRGRPTLDEIGRASCRERV